MALEQRVTRGRVIYISRIEHDSLTKRLVIDIIDDPEHSSEVNRRLTFTEIRSYREDADPTEEDCLENLLGLHERPVGPNLVAYIINTEAREVAFESDEPPILEDLCSTNL